MISEVVKMQSSNTHLCSYHANSATALLTSDGGVLATSSFATSAQGTKADTALQAITTKLEGNLINSATTKTTPVDADMVGLMDSAASNILKKLSWANIKATLKTYFDSLYALTGHNHNEVYLGKTAQAVDSDKLDGKHASEFATASHTHTLPTATSTTLGGVKIGSGVTISSGVISVTQGSIGLGNVNNTADANKSVNYATSAGNADTVDGLHASSFATSGHNHDSRYVLKAGDTMTGGLKVNGNLT